MIKTTGYEFKKFYNDQKVWIEGAYHDDLEIFINKDQWMADSDLEEVYDTDKIEIKSGVIVYEDGSVDDFCKTFRKWFKQQTTVVFIVEAPIEKADNIKLSIKNIGGKIL